MNIYQDKYSKNKLNIKEYSNLKYGDILLVQGKIKRAKITAYLFFWNKQVEYTIMSKSAYINVLFSFIA